MGGALSVGLAANMLNPPAGTPLVFGLGFEWEFSPMPCELVGGLTMMLANWLLTCCLLSKVALSTAREGEGGLPARDKLEAPGARELETRVGGEREPTAGET